MLGRRKRAARAAALAAAEARGEAPEGGSGSGSGGASSASQGAPSAGDNGSLSPQAMRLKVAEFQRAVVADVMIPRADIVAVDLSTPFGDVVSSFAREAHSRMPVYRATLDDPAGFVHIKDVVAEIARGGDTDAVPLERIRRDILFVPPSMPLADLLVKMQATHIHLALVIDEYGGTDGLVSLEDMLEEIVGEIEDEHDEETPQCVRRAKDLWEVDARMEVDAFEEETGLAMALPDLQDEIDTVGGVAYAVAGKVPVRGEVLRHPLGADLEIMDVDGRRIRRIRIRRKARAAPKPAAAAGG